MSSLQATPTPRRGRTELVLLAHQEIEFLALDTKDVIISIGGIGSGKSTSLVLWILWLIARGDFSQVHALFALTASSLRAILQVVDKMLDRIEAVRNRDRVYKRMPPRAFVDDWERRNIVVPPRQDSYENIRIYPCGLHLLLGTVHNRAYEQHRGAEWGSLACEEVGLRGFSKDAFDFLDERVRCGESDEDRDCTEILGHRHVKLYHTNPPEDPDHFLWDVIAAAEREAAATIEGATPFDEASETYPNLIAGVSSTILIPSRTGDNKHVGKRYLESKLARLDSETARRRLDGVLTRTKAGRVYSNFSNLNEIDTFDYDRDRSLWVSLDFNKNPAVATLHHPLKPGEYPSEYGIDGVEHFGTFGTFFHTGGINTDTFVTMLLTGDHGNQSNLPETWAGLLSHNGPIIFYGDATSTFERMAGNDWEIVDDLCTNALGRKYSRDVLDKRPPLVALSVYALAAKILNAVGVRSYWMHSRNSELRKDLLTNAWDKRGKDIQKYGHRPGSTSKLHERGHAADTVRYIAERRYPLGKDGLTPAQRPHSRMKATYKRPKLI